jgi:hypothetical protein
LLGKRLLGLTTELSLQIASHSGTTKIIGKRVSTVSQLRKFFATLRDELVIVCRSWVSHMLS